MKNRPWFHAGLIQAALDMRITDPHSSAAQCSADAIWLVLHGGTPQEVVKRTLAGLQHQVGIHHYAYRRALFVARSMGFVDQRPASESRTPFAQ